MQIQTTRFANLNRATLLAAMVSLNLLDQSDTTDADKVKAATDKLNDKDMEVDPGIQVAAVNALQNGVKSIASTYGGSDPDSYKKYAEAVAKHKFDFEALEKAGYKFSDDLIEALKDGQADGILDEETNGIDNEDIANVVGHLDSAFIALQCAGIKTDTLKRGFAAAWLNSTLDVMAQVALTENSLD